MGLATVGGVAGFFLFVGPGLLWQRLVERRQPRDDLSAFREAGQIALASVVFTSIASTIVLIGSGYLHRSALSDLEELLAEGAKASGVSPLNPVAFLAIEFMIAVTLAWLADLVLGRSWYGKPELSRESAWVTVLRSRVPPSSVPVATVSLRDGSRLRGPVEAWSHDKAIGDRELVLGRPVSRFAPPPPPPMSISLLGPAAELSPLAPPSLIDADHVIVASKDITDIEVLYVAERDRERARHEALVRRDRDPMGSGTGGSAPASD